MVTINNPLPNNLLSPTGIVNSSQVYTGTSISTTGLSNWNTSPTYNWYILESPISEINGVFVNIGSNLRLKPNDETYKPEPLLLKFALGDLDLLLNNIYLKSITYLPYIKLKKDHGNYMFSDCNITEIEIPQPSLGGFELYITMSLTYKILMFKK